MGVTISTHNRSSVARGHNIRKESIVSKEKHIDPNGVHEIWHDEHPREAYKRIFGKAMEEYNAKQKRADRRIKDYYNTIREDKARKCVYEMIIGVYGKNEDGTSKCPRDIGYAIMKEFVDEWQIRNPNLELIGAYYHADEPDAEPHVHIDYIPKAHGYTNGMSVQNGLVKALGEMGFSKNGKATAQILWEKRENEYLEGLCNRYGFEVDHPQVGKGVNHLHTETYKAKTKLENTKKSALDIARKYHAIENEYLCKQTEYDALKNSLVRMQEEKDNLEKELAKKTQAVKDIQSQANSEYTKLTQIRSEIEKGEISLSEIEKSKLRVNTELDNIYAEIDTVKKEYEEIRKAPPKNPDYLEDVEMYRNAFGNIMALADTDKEMYELIQKIDDKLKDNDDYATAFSRMRNGRSL